MSSLKLTESQLEQLIESIVSEGAKIQTITYNYEIESEIKKIKKND